LCAAASASLISLSAIGLFGFASKATGDYGRLPALAVELVSRKVAVLVGVGGDASALAAKQATSTTPIVFGMGGDPVKVGLSKASTDPANATGFTLLTN
jgi:putative ABC transport system substrate-binding protein